MLTAHYRRLTLDIIENHTAYTLMAYLLVWGIFVLSILGDYIINFNTLLESLNHIEGIIYYYTTMLANNISFIIWIRKNQYLDLIL